MNPGRKLLHVDDRSGEHSFHARGEIKPDEPATANLVDWLDAHLAAGRHIGKETAKRLYSQLAAGGQTQSADPVTQRVCHRVWLIADGGAE